MNSPTERDVKKLFALSLNQCAFPNCIASIFGLSDEMIGEICHIKARNPEGPRYDVAQTDTDRHGFGNLILLCRNHHKIVDDDATKYSVEWLKRIKHEHEANGGNELTQHDARLARQLLDSLLTAMQFESNQTTINQTATGTKITQVAGDYHNYEKPPKQKIIITPPAGAVTPAELHQIQLWIESLVANTTGMAQNRAFGMWRNRFKIRFKLAKSEQLLSSQIPDAEAWYRQQSAILKRGLKTKAPDVWRNARYAAIHMAVEKMGADKLAYYAEISSRLNMKKPFDSLTKLTKTDLERVYTMALRDARVS
jgi:hypothetical protein